MTEDAAAAADAAVEVEVHVYRPGDTDDEDDEEVDEHTALDSKFTRKNTPTKRAQSSVVWSEIKRLTGGHPKLGEGYTHVCVCKLQQGGFCNTFLRLTRKKKGDSTSPWCTTKANDHLRNESFEHAELLGTGCDRRARPANRVLRKSFGTVSEKPC